MAETTGTSARERLVDVLDDLFSGAAIVAWTDRDAPSIAIVTALLEHPDLLLEALGIPVEYRNIHGPSCRCEDRRDERRYVTEWTEVPSDDH